MIAPLRDVSDIRLHFVRDETPTWYICATPYTLLGFDEWVSGFRWVSFADCFDGEHPRVFVPPRAPGGATYPFDSLEAMNNHLLRDDSVRAHIRRYGPGRALFLMFDEETEALCRELDLELQMPPAPLRQLVDSKVETTRIADRAGVPSVPNVLGHVDTYDALVRLAGGLGTDLVIQTPYGDSGTTTFFVSGPDDFAKCAAAVSRESEVKVMKRIRPIQAAIEACVTKCGTVVGPLMTEVVGFSELTPYRGGWAGNEVDPDAFAEPVRARAAAHTRRFGAELAKLGYRGYFEIDWLVDADTRELYLGEVNPRLTGATSMTNLAAFAHADVPLALLHLLEYSGLEFELDVDLLNARWSDPTRLDSWSQLIVKKTTGEDVVLTDAPASGVWRLDRDELQFLYSQTHRRTVEGYDQAFVMRIAARGELITIGDDLCIVVMRGRVMEGDLLTERARRWTEAIVARFVA